jgi:hypothetical protein
MTCLSRFRAPLAALLVLLLSAGTSPAQWFPFQGPNPPPVPPASIPNPPPPQSAPAPLAPPPAATQQQQTAPQPRPAPAAKEAPPPSNTPLRYTLNLQARYAADGQNVTRALHWRVFVERPGSANPLFLVSESQDASPTFTVPPGRYVVHVAYGLASFAQRVNVTENMRETIVVAAGGLRLQGRVADAAIPAAKLRYDIYEGNFLQRAAGDGKKKRVTRNERPPVIRGVVPGDLVLLPAGTYYVQSTYGEGNSTITADVRIEAGRLTDATVHHRAAQITLRLVHATGGEALANTSWSVLTPGGDSIKEFIGAFPSIVLADGDYVAVARHDGKTYQATFKVVAGRDREVEVLARGENQAQTQAPTPTTR